MKNPEPNANPFLSTEPVNPAPGAPRRDIPQVGDIVIIRNVDDNKSAPAIVNGVAVVEAQPAVTIPARPGVASQFIPATLAQTLITATMFPAGQNVRFVEDVAFIEDEGAPRVGFQGPARLDHRLVATRRTEFLPTPPDDVEAPVPSKQDAALEAFLKKNEVGSGPA